MTGFNDRTIRRGSENSNAKLNDKQVGEVKALLKTRLTQAQIAKRYGVSKSLISRIHSGITYKYEGE